MFSMIKKLFKNINKTTNNESGNVLIIAIVIVTVLAFSVTTITGMSINLVSNTSDQIENLNDDSEAKAAIRLAISFFEEYVGNDALPTFADFDQFNTNYTNNPSAIYGVTVTDESPESSSGVSKVYKFTYPLSNGTTMVMYDYVSDIGVETTEFEPFEYTIGTSGDMVLNSGVYASDTTVALKMFAENIYFGRRAPYIVNGSANNQELTSDAISEQAVLTEPIAAEVHYNNDLKYCGDGSCFNLNDIGDPMELVKASYSDFAPGAPTDQGTTGSVTIQDFFGDFSYNDYIIDFINNEAPSGGRTISASWSSLAQDIYDNSDPLTVSVSGPWWRPRYRTNWPNNADFVDITENVDYVDFRHDFQMEDTSMVYFGEDTTGFYPYSIPTSTNAPLHLDGDITIGIDESLIVFGDLYLDMTFDTQDILGEIVVTGDCYITGGEKDWEGSLMVFGETFIELSEYKQFETNGQNSGITFMCKDNIYFISHDENHTSSVQSDIFYMFIYTEESIYIDAVNSRYNFSGVLFARALGNSKRTTYSDYMMGDGTDPIRGIVINSFYGYVDDFGGYHDGFNVTSHRFTIDVMSSATYAAKFENLPTFESTVIASTGELNFLTSEFTIE